MQYGQIVFLLFVAMACYYAFLIFTDIRKAQAAQNAEKENHTEEEIDTERGKGEPYGRRDRHIGRGKELPPDQSQQGRGEERGCGRWKAGRNTGRRNLQLPPPWLP